MFHNSKYYRKKLKKWHACRRIDTLFRELSSNTFTIDTKYGSQRYFSQLSGYRYQYQWVENVSFVCLGSSTHSWNFHSYRDITMTSERLQIFTYARHFRPLSSEGSLACHTYCDTGHFNGHLRGHMTLPTIAERLAMELSLPVFTT